MLKRIIAVIACLGALLGLAACSGGGTAPASPEGTEKIKVSVTFDALREFAAAVGGDKVEIAVLIPTGTEPHDFEPKAKDLVGLSKARVFVYNGIGMEPWADQAVTAANNKNLITVDAAKKAQLITNTDQAMISEHGQFDPHLWLSLKGAEIETQNIKDGLVRADPSNKDIYEKNCADFIAQLEKLYAEYTRKFQSVTSKDFVTGHAAFAYLCRDFGLKQNSVEDVFAEGEPTAARLSELVSYCRQNNVKTIFVEDLASPAVSKTLAAEVGATVKTIYTIESSQDNKTYLQRMEENLAAIYDSLK